MKITETFRLSKSTKYLGMGFTAFFLIVVVGFGIWDIFIFKNPDEFSSQTNSVVSASIILYGFFLLLSIYILSTYYIERLVISGTRIAFRSVFQKLEFDVLDLESVRWNSLSGGGGIVFKTLSSRARLQLGGYDEHDRLRIIRAIHNLTPTPLQEGWPLFCHKVALGLRDGRPSFVRTTPPNTLFRVTRKRYDWLALTFLPITIALSIAVWFILRTGGGFLIPFMILTFWPLLRFSVPSEGADQVPIKFNRLGRDQLIAIAVCAALLGACVALIFGLQSFGIKEWIARTIGFIPGIAAFLVMLYAVHKIDKQRRLADEQVAHLALREWEQGEIAVRLPDGS